MNIQRTRLVTKIGRVYALQVALISLAVAAGIYVTNTIVQDFLIEEALRNEADHFWQLYSEDPAQPLPNTNNMRGYLSRDEAKSGVPSELKAFPPGYMGAIETTAGGSMVLVSRQFDADLYLVFASENVSQLAFFFGILPLSIALVLIYGLSFLTYRLSHRAVSPIVKLADYLEEFQFEENRQPTGDLNNLRSIANAEVDVMVDAIESFAERLNAYVERERVFTRDASHELRTPIAVFKGSLDLLQRNNERSTEDLRALSRMRRTVENMEGLVETLLLLAREEDLSESKNSVSINDLVSSSIDQLVPMANKRGVKLVLIERTVLWVQASSQVIQILISNLVRNAINYTREGSVEVEIGNDHITVTDTGIGMSSDELRHAFEPFYRSERGRASSEGHGLGLSIVRRLVYQFSWQISVQSNVGEGTSISVKFR